MNFLSLLPLLVKWGPAVVGFVQDEAPKIHEFIADLQAALAKANAKPAPAPVAHLSNDPMGHLSS